MRAFYKQIFVDGEILRFYAECPVCKKRHWGRSVPLICRRADIQELVENGRAGWLRQRSFNKSRVAAVQELSNQYNHCRSCGRWVCDACYRSENHDGICIPCSEK